MGLELASKSEAATKRVVMCSADKQPCLIEVPVTVNKSGQCVAELPYCVICVRKGEAAKDPRYKGLEVIWQLTVNGQATKDYLFADDRGVDLFYVGQTSKDDFRPGGWVLENGELNKSKFRWIAGRDRSDRLAHGAKVATLDGKPCQPTDPDIINTN